MNNLFQTDLHIQRKYDLKGSTQGRFSGKVPSPNTILKDLDLDIRLKLEEGWHERCALPCLEKLLSSLLHVYSCVNCSALLICAVMSCPMLCAVMLCAVMACAVLG